LQFVLLLPIIPIIISYSILVHCFFNRGGRVNWTATENLPVTDYETTFMLQDDCE